MFIDFALSSGTKGSCGSEQSGISPSTQNAVQLMIQFTLGLQVFQLLVVQLSLDRQSVVQDERLEELDALAQLLVKQAIWKDHHEVS